MHSRRARPTLRVIAEDLTADWASPRPRRLLSEGRFDELHPLSELQHPIIAKAVESFGQDSASDNHLGAIASSTKVRLLEVKAGQWRGGVWLDDATGVHWLVAAGLAKGGHEDHDDFYGHVERKNEGGNLNDWLPTDQDRRLLKQETAARLITEWELTVQKQMRDTLRTVHDGGVARVEITHPIVTRGRMATLTVEVAQVRDQGYECDEIELDLLVDRGYIGTELSWSLTIRALISLCPPDQSWDRHKDSYSNIAEPGYFSKRVAVLDSLVKDGELAESEPGIHAHYTHRQHLAGNTIDGKSVRALCGAFFVPTQDHDSLPRCPTCQERFAEFT